MWMGGTATQSGGAASQAADVSEAVDVAQKISRTAVGDIDELSLDFVGDIDDLSKDLMPRICHHDRSARQGLVAMNDRQSPPSDGTLLHEVDVLLSSPSAWARLWAEAQEHDPLETRMIESMVEAQSDLGDAFISFAPAQPPNASPSRPLLGGTLTTSMGLKQPGGPGLGVRLGRACTSRRSNSAGPWTPAAVDSVDAIHTDSVRDERTPPG